MDDRQLNQMEAMRSANAGLMREGFKIDTLFGMFNNCADRCKLVYAETGIKDESVEGVTCYRNCVTKAYKLAS